MTAKWFIQQANHSRHEWVKRGTNYCDIHQKVHDALCENSWKTDSLLNSIAYGKGRKSVSCGMDTLTLLKSYCWESDWLNDYTSCVIGDILCEFFSQMGELFPAY